MEIVDFIVPKDNLASLVVRQLSSFFPVLSEDEERQLSYCMDSSIEMSVNNFKHSDNKYFKKEIDGELVIRFDAYHSIQWMTFLYYLSHNLWLNKSSLCDRVYYLNKIMHSVDLFYAIDLPSIWSAEHPLGSVMGRAKYSNGFFFYQGCTVGGTKDKDGKIFYPELGENVHMFSNSSILGNCKIGNNVNLGAGAIVKNQDIPDGCTVFGESPNLIIKRKK